MRIGTKRLDLKDCGKFRSVAAWFTIHVTLMPIQGVLAYIVYRSRSFPRARAFGSSSYLELNGRRRFVIHERRHQKALGTLHWFNAWSALCGCPQEVHDETRVMRHLAGRSRIATASATTFQCISRRQPRGTCSFPPLLGPAVGFRRAYDAKPRGGEPL